MTRAWHTASPGLGVGGAVDEDELETGDNRLEPKVIRFGVSLVCGAGLSGDHCIVLASQFMVPFSGLEALLRHLAISETEEAEDT